MDAFSTQGHVTLQLLNFIIIERVHLFDLFFLFLPCFFEFLNFGLHLANSFIPQLLVGFVFGLFREGWNLGSVIDGLLVVLEAEANLELVLGPVGKFLGIFTHGEKYLN